MKYFFLLFLIMEAFVSNAQQGEAQQVKTQQAGIGAGAGDKATAFPVVELLDSGRIFQQAEFKSCHASTIVEMTDRRLMAAWFGGEQEGSPDVCIWGSIREKNGWGKPVRLADGGGIACWNPVLFLSRNNLLYLFYKVGTTPRDWWGMYKVSKDNGASWSEAVRLPEGLLGPIKNKPLQLADGTVLYPSSVESKDTKSWTIHLEASDANASDWKTIPVDCDTFGVIQPSLLSYPGRLQLLARSRQNVIVASWSVDGGKKWSPLYRTELPNPNSGIDAVTAGRLQLLVYNPMPAGKDWWNGRSVLKLAASVDGEHWKDVYTFENKKAGEFSYPAIIYDREGFVDVTYTDDRKNIKFFRLRISGN